MKPSQYPQELLTYLKHKAYDDRCKNMQSFCLKVRPYIIKVGEMSKEEAKKKIKEIMMRFNIN